MEESNLSVVFSKDEVISKDFISVVLDDEANQGKTSFEKGDTVFLQVFYNNEYEYESSGGTLKRTKTKVPTEIEDDFITFAKVSTGYLSYPPSGGVSYSWTGNSGGSPVFDEMEVTLSDPVVAVLKCEYVTFSDRFSLTFNESGAVVVVFISNGGQKSSRTVHFGTDEVEPVPYNIKVTDYCSGSSLDTVNVEITTGGEPIEGEILVGGLTDDSGEVYLGALIPGRRYDLSMSKSGYLSSSSDKLNNDYFVVPS